MTRTPMLIPATLIAATLALSACTDNTEDTSAASIPLALVYGAVSGRLRAGARVLMPAFGGGATWGAVAITWPDVSVVPYEDEALLALSASNQRTSTIAPGRPDATLST